MSSSRSRRAPRPVIAPIKTDTASFPDGCHRFSNRLSIPYSGMTRSRLNSLGCAQDVIHSSASPMRRNLSVPEVMSDTSEVMTPFGTVWISRQVCPTPVSDVSPRTKGWPAVVEAHAIRPRQMSMGHGDMFRQSTAGALRMSYVNLSANRRRSMPAYGAAHRQLHMQLQQIRQYRHSLWEQGHRIFGRSEEADFLVKPLQLRRPRREIRSWSEGPSSASPLSKRVWVRAIIRSKSHVPIGLKREFDLDDLRATIPDPIPSPQSSNFNREVLLSRLELSDEDVDSQSPVDSEMADDGDSDVVVKTEKPDMPPFLKHPKFLPKATSVPMSVQYARAQLPALAAIMMSNRVRRGDTIELAMPHPSAWPSTVAYVYTGERELLKDNVRENILYLGGKI
ncbi:hypothetical protein FP744_10007065 [Trichoderma asperellum]|nr:hypothetical protein LI328DRAFT_171315 [Trichoderma asperelloides]